jgi:hypothetical protein
LKTGGKRKKVRIKRLKPAPYKLDGALTPYELTIFYR